jgi:hypothetical protein
MRPASGHSSRNPTAHAGGRARSRAQALALGLFLALGAAPLRALADEGAVAPTAAANGAGTSPRPDCICTATPAERHRGCEICKGQIYLPCVDCAPDPGPVSIRVPRGAGFGPGYVPCKACGGKGFVEGVAEKTCLQCLGNRSLLCEGCFGKGRKPCKRRLACEDCKVPSPCPGCGKGVTTAKPAGRGPAAARAPKLDEIRDRQFRAEVSSQLALWDRVQAERLLLEEVLQRPLEAECVELVGVLDALRSADDWDEIGKRRFLEVAKRWDSAKRESMTLKVAEMEIEARAAELEAGLRRLGADWLDARRALAEVTASLGEHLATREALGGPESPTLEPREAVQGRLRPMRAATLKAGESIAALSKPLVLQLKLLDDHRFEVEEMRDSLTEPVANPEGAGTPTAAKGSEPPQRLSHEAEAPGTPQTSPDPPAARPGSPPSSAGASEVAVADSKPRAPPFAGGHAPAVDGRPVAASLKPEAESTNADSASAPAAPSSQPPRSSPQTRPFEHASGEPAPVVARPAAPAPPIVQPAPARETAWVSVAEVHAESAARSEGVGGARRWLTSFAILLALAAFVSGLAGLIRTQRVLVRLLEAGL